MSDDYFNNGIDCCEHPEVCSFLVAVVNIQHGDFHYMCQRPVGTPCNHGGRCPLGEDARGEKKFYIGKMRRLLNSFWYVGCNDGTVAEARLARILRECDTANEEANPSGPRKT